MPLMSFDLGSFENPFGHVVAQPPSTELTMKTPWLRRIHRYGSSLNGGDLIIDPPSIIL